MVASTKAPTSIPLTAPGMPVGVSGGGGAGSSAKRQPGGRSSSSNRGGGRRGCDRRGGAVGAGSVIPPANAPTNVKQPVAGSAHAIAIAASSARRSVAIPTLVRVEGGHRVDRRDHDDVHQRAGERALRGTGRAALVVV